MRPSTTASRAMRCAIAGLAIASGGPAATAAVAERAGAQELEVDTAAVRATGRYRVSAVTGLQTFDKSAALKSAPLLGIRLGGTARNLVSFGAGAVFARPTTRGDYFPWVRQPYYSTAVHRNDTTLIFQVSQRVTLATYGVDAGVRFGGGDGGRSWIGRPAIELGAGAGGYTFWLDPEQVRANRIFSGPQVSFGGGIGVPFGRASSVGVRVDDVVFLRYDRERLSVSDPLFAEDLFPNPDPAPPAAKRTVHNVRFSVLFSFVPGAR